MLLASPAFSTFLNDLSGSVSSSSAPTQAPSSSVPTPGLKIEQTQSQLRKDVNPHQATALQAQHSQENDQQIGMTLMPEQTIDYTAFDTSNSAWIDNNMDTSLYDAQVFAVTELPRGPSFDQLNLEVLSDKSPVNIGSHTIYDCKAEAPCIELIPESPIEVENTSEEYESNEDVTFDELDPAFALFAENSPTSQTPLVDPEEQLFGSLGLEKAFGRVELILEDDLSEQAQVSSGTMERFHRLCSSMEAASERIFAVTSHL